MNPMEFLGEFRDEAVEKLDLIAAQLLRLERDVANPQAVREMFLAAHTVKGGAAMLRLTDVEALAHALEDLLSAFRDTTRTLDAATADLLFQTIDRLRGLIGAASADAVGAEPNAATLEFAERLRAAASGTPVVAPSAQATVWRALVVEDSPTVSALHTQILERSGYEVDTVDDGQTALQYAARSAYALIISGLQLAGCDGFELTRTLRQQAEYATVPIVLMSADADASLAALAQQCGASILVRKASLQDEQLTSALRSLVH